MKKFLNKKDERLYLLDVCRGIAAYCIVIFHYKIFYNSTISNTSFERNMQPFYNILFPAYEFGWVAVQFFFTISGFIFYYLYYKKINDKKISWKSFFILRFSRLYPLHFITLNSVLILYLIFVFLNVELFSFSEINIKHYLLNILLISNWGFENQASFNTPSWSVSIEIMLYIIFFLTARKKIKIFYSTTLLILFSIFLFYFNKLIGYGFFCFFIGGFTFLIFEKINSYKTKKINFIIFFLLISIIIIFFIKLYKVTDIQFKILILTIFFPSLIIALVFIQKVYKKLGEKISLIGDISYSVYLIHLTIQISLFLILKFNNIKLNFNSNLTFISYITIITVISFLSYKYFEKPSQSFLRKKIKN